MEEMPQQYSELNTTLQSKLGCHGVRIKFLGLLIISIEFLIVATYYFDSHTMKVYAQRWTIECFFKAIKSAGFNIEQTHLTDAKRLEKLFAIIAIAFVWIYKIGQYQNQNKPIKSKSHGRRELSIFRYGLDNFYKALLFDYQLVITFIKLLSCT